MGNEYLKSLREKERAYYARKKELNDRLCLLFEERGKDDKEFVACKEKLDALGDCPVSKGAKAVCRAEELSVQRECSEFEVENFIEPENVHDFVETMRKAGIESFVYTNESIWTMGNICAFVKEGCEIDNACTLTQHNRYGRPFGKETLALDGIRILTKNGRKSTTVLNHEDTHCADYSEDCPEECYRGRLVRDLAGVPVNKVRWAFLKGTEECKEIIRTHKEQ